MTFAKASALALGFVIAFALGVWTGPYLMDRGTAVIKERPAARVTQPSGTATKSRAARAERETRETRDAAVSGLSASEPEVHARVKPLLNMGTKMELASEGFRDAEQFATVARAARNTQIPFAVLKHRVLNEGKTLAQAIRESNPEVNAAAEVRRARAEAREDLASVRG
jgi:hypothetical protein